MGIGQAMSTDQCTTFSMLTLLIYAYTGIVRPWFELFGKLLYPELHYVAQ